jgi:hypothetical protein
MNNLEFGVPLPGIGPVIYRDVVVLDNDAKYEGEWKFGTIIRQGKGKQVWPDGSIYEGYFVNNMASGTGKLIHPDGDIYDGEWRDDKAHGYGIYQHLNGSKFEGEWLNDK